MGFKTMQLSAESVKLLATASEETEFRLVIPNLTPDDVETIRELLGPDWYGFVEPQ